MRKYGLSLALALAGMGALALPAAGATAAAASPPHLERRGEATQLIVNGRPFLMLAGELHNSSSSSLAYMKPIWPRLEAMHLNTVVTPLSWELIEPRPGQYDFHLLDGLLAQARAAHMHIVFLWLATWKNGMSSYAPVWVKRDTGKYRRVIVRGRPVEILSPFDRATRAADAAAFAAVMRHIRAVDGQRHTVLMMQVENEVGVLGASRDRSPAANRAFAGPVPARLLHYLETHKTRLNPDFLRYWRRQGEKTQGSWAQVFGQGARAGQIFMAWYYARYIQAVTAAGKAAYDLPMYVNTWLAGHGQPPGMFPSGGPEPFVQDIWRAAGHAIDIYSPDLYASNFSTWCRRYHVNGNPLWMPETTNGPAAAGNVFYDVGEEYGLGFSPFAIDTPFRYHLPHGREPWNFGAGGGYQLPTLAASYQMLAQLWPRIAERETHGQVRGFALNSWPGKTEFNLNGYRVHVSLDEIFGHRASTGFGLIMADGPNRFLGAGRGFKITFTSLKTGEPVGLAWVDSGHLRAGRWVPGRRLNGDEDEQGGAWRFDGMKMHLEKAEVYRMEK